MSSPNNFKYRSLLVTLLIAALICGCGKDEGATSQGEGDRAGPQPPALGGSAVEPQGEEGDAPNHPAVGEWERSYEWDRKQIAKRHHELALAELPAYVKEVRGVGGKPKDGGIYGDWAFVVPQDHIADFESYLGSLGVPEEFMRTNSPYRVASRESGWAPPNPQATILEFERSQQISMNAVIRGLGFERDTSWLFVFDNPNFRNSTLHIIFDFASGSVHVTEKCIDW